MPALVWNWVWESKSLRVFLPLGFIGLMDFVSNLVFLSLVQCIKCYSVRLLISISVSFILIIRRPTGSSLVKNDIDLNISGLKFQLQWHVGSTCVCERNSLPPYSLDYCIWAYDHQTTEVAYPLNSTQAKEPCLR